MSNRSHTTIAPPRELSPEMQTLVAGLRGSVPDTPSLSWPDVCRLAWAHGVAPLLHQAWSSQPDLIPAAVIADLGELRRRSRKQALVGLRQRTEILRLLDEAGIRPIVLKGGAWARHWYGDVSLRPINDVDLLLPARDMPIARNAFLAAGYHELDSSGAPHHDLPLQHPQKPLAVELHRCLVALPAARQLEYDDVAARSITLQDKDADVPALDPEDTLLHLCMHVLQHIESEPGWRLLNVWDIYRHMETCTIRWDVFAARAQDSGIAAACSAALGLVIVLADAHVPAGQGDSAVGRQLLAFPYMHSSTPVVHRGVLTMLDVLSHPREWRTWPQAMQSVLSRGLRTSDQVPVTNAAEARQERVSPLAYFAQEVWWLIRESWRMRTGEIVQGIRQLHWEEQARNTVYDLVRRAETGRETESVGVADSEEPAWSARP